MRTRLYVAPARVTTQCTFDTPRWRTFRSKAIVLKPAEALFDPLPPLLTAGMTRVSRGAAINRTAARPSQILRHMRSRSPI